MKKATLALICMIVLTTGAWSQPTLDWQSTTGGANDETMLAMCPLNDDGFIAVGRVRDGIYNEAYFARFRPDGTIMWSNTWAISQDDVELADVCLADNGTDVLAVGTAGYLTGEADVLLLRISIATGAVFDSNTIDISYSDNGYAISPNGIGSYAIAGYSSIYGYAATINNSLAVTLDNLIGPDTAQGFLDIKPVSTGGFIACGTIWEGTDFIDADEFWIVRLDAALNMTWEHRSGGWGEDYAASIIETANGSFMACGTRYENTLGADDYRLWAMRLNTSGNVQWTRYFGAASGYEFGRWVDTAPDGTFYLGGYGSSSATNGYDTWLININGNGNQLWNQIYGGTGDQYAYDWAQLGTGYIGATGWTPGVSSQQGWGMRLAQPAPLLVNIEPLTPNLVIPAGGGTFQYRVEVENTTPNDIVHDAWVQVQYTGSQSAVEVRFWPNSQFPANQLVSAVVTQTIPANAPGGYYNMSLQVGDHPWQPMYWDSFRFIKSGSAADDLTVLDTPSMWPGIGGFDLETTVVTAAEDALPASFSLSPAYPNPFNPSTTLNVTLPEAATLTVAVYNVTGQQVAELARGSYTAGSHTLTFDASGLTSGVYFVHASANGWSAMQKVMLVR